MPKEFRRFNAMQREMARQFVHGPIGVRGDWRASAKAAGYIKPPVKDHPSIRSLIVEEGEQDPARVPAPEPAKQSVWEGIQLPQPDDPEAMTKWKAIGYQLLPTWLAIASGEQDADPTQRQVLKDIMERAFGKAGVSLGDEEKEDTGVVVLPALGSGHRSMICPKCLYRLKESDVTAASESK